MKKLLGAAFLLAIASLALVPAAYAQRFGPPACATCITPNNPTPGVPGSATSFTAFNPPPSMGFTAFNPPPSMGFTAFNPPPSYGTNSASFRGNSGVSVSVDINAGWGRGGRHHSRGYGYGYGYGYAPIVYPYPVYVPVETEPAQPVADVPSGNALDREMWSRAAERDPNLTAGSASSSAASNDLRSNDPRYGTHYLDSREAAGAASNQKADSAPAPKEDNGQSIVLILRDGTRVELGNYAIVGQNIFDLGSAPHHKKIPLAGVDLAATQKANDALGLDFKLPSR